MTRILYDYVRFAAAVIALALICVGAPKTVQAQTAQQQLMAGAFVVQVEFQAPPLGTFVEALLLTPDGGVVREGSANPPGQDWSAGIGAWTTVAPSARRARFRFFVFAANEGGEPLATHRIRALIEFSPDFQTFVGTFEDSVISFLDDPLDPDAPPIASFTGTISGRRIQP